MALNSFGYPTSIAPGAVLADWSTHATGRRYTVAGHSDFRVTAAASGTRRVNIAAGYASGNAVGVENTASMTYDLPAPSGSSQWFAIVLNRWVSDGLGGYLSQVGHVAGTASRAVPSLTQNPGTADAQPLALVRVASDSTIVKEVVDLRLISNEAVGFYVAHSSEALDLASGLIGTDVYRTDTSAFYRRISNVSGALSWKRSDQPDQVLTGLDAVGLVENSGWGRQDGCRMTRNGDHRSLIAHMRKGPGGGFTSNGTTGGIGDILLATTHSIDSPPSGTVLPLIGRVLAGSATYGCFGTVSSTGSIILHSMLPNVTVSPGDEVILAGEWYR